MRDRGRAPIETTHALVETIKSAIPAPAQFAGGHPAKRTFQAIRIAVNEELEQLDRALAARVGAARARTADSPRSRFHSLEDRRVKRFLAERARGCICPPDLPVCGCGRTPEGELLSRRAIAPTPGEVAHNPRAKSAHLRGARKLHGGGVRMTPPARRHRRRTPRRTGSPLRAHAASAAAGLRSRAPARGPAARAPRRRRDARRRARSPGCARCPTTACSTA